MRLFAATGRNVGLALVVSAAFLRTLAACVDLDSLGNGQPDGGTPPTVDSEVEASIPDPCAHSQPPGPPAADDVTDGGTVTPNRFVLSIDKASVVSDVGYDLDGVCTCDTRPGSARGGSRACTPRIAPPPDEDPTCDLDGGVDNKLAELAQNQGLGNELETRANVVIDKGLRTLLIQIVDYNGLANDTKIAVGVLPAEGIRENNCGDASTFQDASGTWTPGRCGSDKWSIAEFSAVGVVPTVAANGHVNDYQLVARFKAQDIVRVPFTADTSVDLQSVVISGTLVPLDTSLQPRDKTRGPKPAEARLYQLEGTISGRVSATNLLTTLGSYAPSSLGGERLCTAELFTKFRTTLCSGLDLTVTDTNDPTVLCDAMSGSIRFTAIPALQGPAVPPPAVPTECEALGQVTCP